MKIFGWEPAMIAYAVNAGVALLISFGLDLTQDQVSVIAVITTAILAAVTAAMTRPVVVSALTGAVGSLLTAVAAFGFEWSADQIGAFVTGLSIVLALLLRQNVSPANTSP